MLVNLGGTKTGKAPEFVESQVNRIVSI